MATVNKHPGKCYICGHPVGPGDGFVMKHGSRWIVWHGGCKTMRDNANP